jgi:5-formyltetrahydrofolate cyclo-ligase
LRDLPIAPATTIAGIWPMPGEMDLRPLLHALHARGNPIVLPDTPPRGQPLVFRRWTPGTEMLPERFGTFRPDGPIAIPDIIFVPLLAFDRRGYRLGYGGGYYDRTLHALPNTTAIGFGYAAQQIADIPTEAHDIPLPTIVTERSIIHASR